VHDPEHHAGDKLCTRCAAVGTHYLTCPTLQLPPGYTISNDPCPEDGPEETS
jgi:hypothetical protein